MNIILKSDADSWFGRIVMRRIYCNFPLFEVQTVCLHRRRPGVPLSPPDLLRRTVGNLVLQADTDGISLLFIPQGGGACECGCVCAASQFLIMTWLLCVCTPEEGWGGSFWHQVTPLHRWSTLSDYKVNLLHMQTPELQQKGRIITLIQIKFSVQSGA